jgi:integrase
MKTHGLADPAPRSWLVVSTTKDGQPVYEAGWRHQLDDGRQRTMKRRLGRAWLVQADEGGFEPRRGRVKPGFFDEQAAIVEKDRLVREVERELAEQAAAAVLDANAPVTFREIANSYLDWLTRVQGAKPATIRDHGYLLAEPGVPYRRGQGVCEAAIMTALGDRAAAEVTTREINTLLERVADRGVSDRTVNKHRQLICAIYNYASQEASYGLAANPATRSDRRREPEPARLDFYQPGEIEQLAGALETGKHRDPNGVDVGREEQNARAADDKQDAELVRVAAYTGLRRGELLALRWRDVDFPRDKVVVQRAISANVEASSTKSRRAREVPLPSQAAHALERLTSRGEFTAADDYVFVNRFGRRLDGSALRRRFERARDAAGLRPLRFHDLRHTYGSLLVAGGVDLASVKSAMGHSRITTTERYLHARSATELADRFTHALGSS